MISEETPYKLAEVIRDTWPQLYRPLRQPVQSGTMDTQSHDEHDREPNY